MDLWTIFTPANLSDPGHLFGHFTYVLLILSVLMRRMVWLRALAISSGVAKIVYRLFFVFDPVSVFWEAVFVLVNVVQLLLIWWENRKPDYSAEEKHFVDSVAPALPPATVRRLLRSGRWTDLAAGETLTRDGQPVDALTFISSGEVQIEKHGARVGTCGPGDFVGEMTFASGKAATATSVATTATRVLRFERKALDAAQAARPVIRIALEASFNRNLIDKLQRSNAARVPAAVETPSTLASVGAI